MIAKSITIELDDAIKIREVARMIAESGNGPDLGNMVNRINERWPELKEFDCAYMESDSLLPQEMED